MCKESHSNLNKYAIEKNATKRLTQKESRNDRNARRQISVKGNSNTSLKLENVPAESQCDKSPRLA